MRRLNPKLLAAFEQAGIEPLEMDTPGRVVEVPVPPEQMQVPQAEQPAAPRSRFDVVSEYLQRSRQPIAQPDAPEVDVRAAADSDARRNFGGAMLAAGQAFTGNRRAVGQLPSSNAQEAQALDQQAARRRALAEWAQAQERQRMGEAGLLGQALSADEAAKARADALGVQKTKAEESTRAAGERLDLDKTKAEEQARHNAAMESLKKKTPKAVAPTKGLAAGYELTGETNPVTAELTKHQSLVASAEKMKGLTQQMRAALAGASTLDRLNPVGEKRNAIKQLATMIAIEGKNIAELGALSGPDYALMNSIAADPTSVASLTKDLPALLSQLDAWGDNSVAAKSKALGVRPKAAGDDTSAAPTMVKVRRKADGVVKMMSQASAAKLDQQKFEVVP